MEYRMVIEEHAGYKMLHTYLTGELTAEDRDRVGAEAIRTLRENGLYHSIWDVREAEVRYSLTKMHMSIVNVQETGLRGDLRVAVVYRPDQEGFEHARTAAYNRSIYNLNYFEDLEEAIQWLASK